MTERRFGEPPRGERVSSMMAGVFYDLDPPSTIDGKIFRRVQCDFEVPNEPNQYVVHGIPEGSDQQESFVLRFTERGTKVTRSPTQEADTMDASKLKPHLKLVN